MISFGNMVIMAGIDDDIPYGSTYSLYLGYYVIWLPDSESISPSANSNSLVLNLFSNNKPGNGTYLTRAPYTGSPSSGNGTQWFIRAYYTVPGTSTIYSGWACYNDTDYSMNCTRLNTTGSYVNVYRTVDNPYGDWNTHSNFCFPFVGGTHHIVVGPRGVQAIHGSGMVMCKTNDYTGYTNNYYLKWSPNDGSTSMAAHVFYKSKNMNTFIQTYYGSTLTNLRCAHDNINNYLY